MKYKLARTIEPTEIKQAQAQIICLTQARLAKQKPELPAQLDGADYEDFLAHYGKGIASDFA